MSSYTTLLVQQLVKKKKNVINNWILRHGMICTHKFEVGSGIFLKGSYTFKSTAILLIVIFTAQETVRALKILVE